MRDLPIDLLRTFVAVVESGTMANAARLVGLTPSAASLQMSKLVGLIGKQFIRQERAGQGLTAAGETLLRHSREILAATERAWSELSEEAMQGPVRFGRARPAARAGSREVLDATR